MADKDMISDIASEVALASQDITSNTTTVGAIHDTQGFCSASFLIEAGTITDGDYVVRVVEGEDPGLSDGADAAADRLLGVTSYDSTQTGKSLRTGYVGHKRFIRLEIDSTNVTTGTAATDAKAVLGHPQDGAVANPSN